MGYSFDTFFFRPEAKYLDFYLPCNIVNDPFSAVRVGYLNNINLFSIPKIFPGQYVLDVHRVKSGLDWD